MKNCFSKIRHAQSNIYSRFERKKMISLFIKKTQVYLSNGIKFYVQKQMQRHIIVTIKSKICNFSIIILHILRNKNENYFRITFISNIKLRIKWIHVCFQMFVKTEQTQYDCPAMYTDIKTKSLHIADNFIRSCAGHSQRPYL